MRLSLGDPWISRIRVSNRATLCVVRHIAFTTLRVEMFADSSPQAEKTGEAKLYYSNGDVTREEAALMTPSS